MLITHQLDNIQKYIKETQLDVTLNASRYRKLIFIRRVTEAIMITLFTYVGLYLGPQDALNTPVWPHTGVLLGVLFLRGLRVAPWIFLGSLLTFWQSGFSWGYNLSACVFTTLSPILCYWISHLFAGAVIPLSRVKPLLITLCLLCVLGLSFGCGYFHMSNWFEGGVYPQTYLWPLMLSYTAGLIVFTPICLIWDTYIPGMRSNPIPKKLIALAIFIGLTHFGFGVFTHPVLVGSFYLISLLMMTPITLLYGQFGCSFLGVFTGIFLLSFKDLPGHEILKTYPHAMTWMQCALILNVGLHLTLATRIKERYFLEFINKSVSERSIA